MAEPNDHRPTFSWFYTLVAVALVVAILYFTQEVLLPFALAVLLSFLLTPLVIWLERLKIGRIPAVLGTVALAFAVIGGIGWIVTDQMVRLAGDMNNTEKGYEANLRSRARSLGELMGSGSGGLAETVERIQKEAMEAGKKATEPSAAKPAAGKGGAADGPGEAEAKNIPGATPENALYTRTVEDQTEPLPVRLARDWLAPLLGPLGTAAVVIVFVIFMLLQREDLRDRLIRLAGTGRVYVTTQAIDEAAARVSSYLLMQFIINATYGLALAAGLWLIDLPNALLWGLLAAVFRFIPYVGPWVAALFPIALSLAVSDAWGMPLMVVGLFLVLELVSNNVMEPWLYGSSTGVSAVGIILAAAFWTWLWGPIGLVLSMPLTVCLVVVGRHVPQLNFLNVLLSDQPALELKVRFYQRLLAFDEHEAGDLADTFLRTGSLDDLYEKMLIPALSMSERDRNEGRLSENQQRFIHRVVRSMLGEMGKQFDMSAAGQTAPAGAAQESAAATPAAPDDRPLRILCIPAEDRADRIAGQMLVQLLNARGHQAEAVTNRVNGPEVAAVVERRGPDIVVVSGLAPGGGIPARDGAKRLRAKFPTLKIVIGLWNAGGSIEGTRERMTGAGADFVTTSIKEALEWLPKHARPAADGQPSKAASSTAITAGK